MNMLREVFLDVLQMGLLQDGIVSDPVLPVDVENDGTEF